MKTVLKKPCINRGNKSRKSHFSYKVIVVTWTWTWSSQVPISCNTNTSYLSCLIHMEDILTKRIFHRWKSQVVEGTKLGNTMKYRKLCNTLPLIFLWVLILWTRGKSHLHNQGPIWEDQVRGWLAQDQKSKQETNGRDFHDWNYSPIFQEVDQGI